MDPICGQVNIPTVDNTNKSCDIIVSSDCLLLNIASSTLDVQIGDTLAKLITNLTRKLSQQDIKIYELQQEIEILKNPPVEPTP